MNTQQNVTFDGLISEIRRLCQEKVTGTLFFNGKNGSLAQLSLQEGKLVLLSCANKHGMEAVSLIRQIHSGSFQFIKMNISQKSSLPETADILAALSDGARPSTTIAASSAVLTRQTVPILRDMLAEYIGPVALLLCNARLEGTSVESALEILAKEIPDPQSAKQFMEKSRKKLQ